MNSSDRLIALPLVLLLLCACENSDDDGSAGPDPEPPAPQRGDLIGEAPALVASYSPDELIALASTNDVTQLLVEEILTPECGIDVYHFEYQTVDPAGDIVPASAALMVPTIQEARASRQRPIVLYAHGTNTNKGFDMADLEGSASDAPSFSQIQALEWARALMCAEGTQRSPTCFLYASRLTSAAGARIFQTRFRAEARVAQRKDWLLDREPSPISRQFPQPHPINLNSRLGVSSEAGATNSEQIFPLSMRRCAASLGYCSREFA